MSHGNQQSNDNSYGSSNNSYGSNNDSYGSSRNDSYGSKNDSYGSSRNDSYGSSNNSYGSNNDSYGSDNQPSNNDSYGSNDRSSDPNSYGSNNDSYGSKNQSSDNDYSSNSDSYGSNNRSSNNDSYGSSNDNSYGSSGNNPNSNAPPAGQSEDFVSEGVKAAASRAGYNLRLAPELICHIATLCAHGTLPSLARTHSSFLFESERVLYRDVHIRTATKELECLRTLTAHRYKASLVRSLIVESPPGLWTKETYFLVLSICTALRHTHGLVDLYLRLPVEENPELGGISWRDIVIARCMLTNTLRCKDRFQLRNLYCSARLDFVEIVQAHPKLEALGLYAGDSYIDSVVDLVQCAYEEAGASARLPAIFVLERDMYHPIAESQCKEWNHLSIFPTFYAPGLDLPAACARSLEQHVGPCAREQIFELSVYVDDLLDIPRMKAIAQDAVSRFPNIDHVNLLADEPFLLDYTRLTEVLVCFPHLARLSILPWHEGDEYRPKWDIFLLSEAEQMYIEALWGDACPNLKEVVFPKWACTFGIDD
ncbi:hypothetical protein H0H81_000204 [Sphagnurus paluster]|uniref:Uncharacterized protein n=1 Tax=Sphagnurus paluster TaxID=117069 RepID=A0A9P7GJ38_9AGAR|nr:hypothetical protein H0H81_000204 [Sphagnurus paluster]